MAEEFDPYRKWLGIPPKDQPPHYYRLLGIANFEDDPDVIENAASRQMVHVRTFQTGKHGAISQRILNELAAARLCLLQPAKKEAYDAELRERLAASGRLSSEAPLDAAVEEEPGYPPPPPTDFRGEGRWRTGNDPELVSPSPGPAPVPIPMPPAAPPPVAVAAPVVNLQTARRGGYSAASSRARKKSSALPMMLMIGSIIVLVIGGLVAVPLLMKSEPATQHHSKHPKPHAPHQKPVVKRPVANTPFRVGSQEKPASKSTAIPSPQPIANRPIGSGNETRPVTEADYRTELTKARAALSRRSDSDFRLHVGQTIYLVDEHKPANGEELKAEAAHLQEVDQRLSQFWTAVREGTDKKIPKGEKFKFRKQELELVAREGEQLTYRVDGKEETGTIKQLPARVAAMIAYRVFGDENLDGKIALATFLAIDADADTDSGNHRLAVHLLDQIHKAGVTDNPVVEREVGKLPKMAPTGDDDFSPPVVVSAAPASS